MAISSNRKQIVDVKIQIDNLKKKKNVIQIHYHSGSHVTLLPCTYPVELVKGHRVVVVNIDCSDKYEGKKISTLDNDKVFEYVCAVF